MELWGCSSVWLLSCSIRLQVFGFSLTFSLETEVSKHSHFWRRTTTVVSFFRQHRISTFCPDKFALNGYLQCPTHYSVWWSCFLLTSEIFLFSALISVIVMSLQGYMSSWILRSVVVLATEKIHFIIKALSLFLYHFTIITNFHSQRSHRRKYKIK